MRTKLFKKKKKLPLFLDVFVLYAENDWNLYLSRLIYVNFFRKEQVFSLRCLATHSLIQTPLEIVLLIFVTFVYTFVFFSDKCLCVSFLVP